MRQRSMQTENLSIILSVISTIAVAIVGYFSTRRQSRAAEAKTESERDVELQRLQEDASEKLWLKVNAELDKRDKRIDRLESEVDKLEGEVEKRDKHIIVLEEQNRQKDEQNRLKDELIAELRSELESVKKRLLDLEGRAK